MSRTLFIYLIKHLWVKDKQIANEIEKILQPTTIKCNIDNEK